MNNEVLLVIGLLLSVATLMTAIFAAAAAHRASTREISERVIEREKDKIVKEYETVPFPNKAPLDIDSYLTDLSEHIEQNGIKGKSVKDFLYFLYGENYQDNWSRDNRKVWNFDNDD